VGGTPKERTVKATDAARSIAELEKNAWQKNTCAEDQALVRDLQRRKTDHRSQHCSLKRRKRVIFLSGEVRGKKITIVAK